jgi:hypothetical protein
MAIEEEDDFDSMYGSKYLAATDLKKPVTATIELAERAEFAKPGETAKKKVVLYVKGGKKGIVVNKTNALSLAQDFGKDPDGWVGQRIIIRAERTTFAGKPTLGLRLYPAENEETPMALKAPVKSKPKPSSEEDFDDQIDI